MGRPARILLVEDDPALARLILGLLDPPEWQVLPVCRLADALGAVDAWRADLVILDRNLPDGDGLELCRAVRARRGSNVRVLVVTCRQEAQDRAEAFAAGADEYLVKPVPPLELRTRVLALLRSKLAEDALKEREAQVRLAEKEIRKFKLALEQSPATVVVTSLDGTIEYVNNAFQELTGYTSQEAVGMNTRELKSGQQGRAFYQDLWQTIRNGRIWRGRFNNRKKNGELFWEKATIAPVFEQGGITCYVAVKEDVTELMRAEQDLRAAKVEAETASQAKSAFLANMSHEIRTPLNAVLGFIELLKGTGLTAQQQGYLDKAGVSAQHLHAIISEILDFSKIEAGRIELETVPFDLRETLDKVSGTLSRRAAEKGLRLSFDRAADVPPLLVGDPMRLGQVLLHLVDNAVKFTEAGAVTLAVRLLERANGQVRLSFTVDDTGIGMSREEMGSLFQPFTQADASSTRRFGGTGLGLAISQRLARLMGGDLEGTSRPGQGSSFSLTLALHEALPEWDGGSPARPAGDGAQDGRAMESAGEIQGVDLSGTLARLELDRETYLGMLRRFAAGQAGELAGIRAALDLGDRETAMRHAHSLKGAALNLGANAISAAARLLEEGLGGGSAWQEPLAALQARLEGMAQSLAAMPGQAAAPGAAVQDWPAVLGALAALRQALLEDDARAGREGAALAALLKGSPLGAALAPMKARVESYDYGRALELFPAFLAAVEREAQGETP